MEHRKLCYITFKGGGFMKNKIIILVIFTLSVAVVSAFVTFNNFFPKAPEINFPKTEEIVSASVSFKNEEKEIEKENLTSIASEIEKSSPTRRQSINDSPEVRPYYALNVSTAERYYCFYIYEYAGGIYIELPYEGIYLSDIRVMEFVSAYFTE